VLRNPFNLGIGGAMQAGYVFALERGYDLAVQVDGDGQHDAGQIRRLREHLDHHPELHMVTGSRFLAGEQAEGGYRSSATRRMGIRIFARLLSMITRQRITDPTSGFRMTTRRGIELFARDYPHDYPEVEAVVMLHHHRLRSAEVPVLMRARAGGRSSIAGHWSAFYMVKVLLAVLVGLFRSRPTVEAGEQAAVTAEHAI
jgi:glycosyltransferase involved in cell wall biosynthesis